MSYENILDVRDRRHHTFLILLTYSSNNKANKNVNFFHFIDRKKGVASSKQNVEYGVSILEIIIACSIRKSIEEKSVSPT